MKLVANPSFSINVERSKETDKTIRDIGNVLKTVINTSFPTLPLPIIAGGAIRDMVYGNRVKDYDIFLDVSSVDEDERDDVVMLVGHYVLTNLAPLYPLLTGNGLRHVTGESYFGKGNTEPKMPGSFVVYENYMAEDMPEVAFNNPQPWTQLQFIGRVDASIGNDPFEFVNNFDYDLVKAFYKIDEKDYFFHQAFIDATSSLEIKASSERTHRRILSWKYRYEEEGFNVYSKQINFPFTVKETYVKEFPVKYFANTTATNTYLNALPWRAVDNIDNAQMFLNNGRAMNIAMAGAVIPVEIGQENALIVDLDPEDFGPEPAREAEHMWWDEAGLVQVNNEENNEDINEN